MIPSFQIIDENGTHIFITLQISNLTSLANVDPQTNVTAYSAMQRITQNSMDSQLPFQIQIYPNISVTPTLYKSRRGPNVTQCTNDTKLPAQCNCKNQTNITTQLGFSDGAVAGVAIALFILGVILGVLLQLILGVVIRWYRSNSTSLNLGESIKYKKQEDELKIT